jgi:hypothetical protein
MDGGGDRSLDADRIAVGPRRESLTVVATAREESGLRDTAGALHFFNVPLNNSTPAVLIIVRR